MVLGIYLYRSLRAVLFCWWEWDTLYKESTGITRQTWQGVVSGRYEDGEENGRRSEEKDMVAWKPKRGMKRGIITRLCSWAGLTMPCLKVCSESCVHDYCTLLKPSRLAWHLQTDAFLAMLHAFHFLTWKHSRHTYLSVLFFVTKTQKSKHEF